jgi:dolichol kinase
VASSHFALSSPPLSLRHELLRKALHLSAAAFPVAYGLGASRGALETILALTSVAALLIEALRRSSVPIGAAFEKILGPLIRGREKRGITGATWLALSCLVAVAVLSRNAAIAALWCATVGDPAATLFGKWSASNTEPDTARDGKTFAGSVACLIASFAGVWMLAGYAPVIAVPIAIAATLAESWPMNIDDNIRVVAASGMVAQLLA